jgi:hypothetical protein
MPTGLSDVSVGSGLGDQLRAQAQAETEEERRKRLLALQRQASVVPLGSAVGGLGSVSRSLGAGLLGR